MRSEKLWKKGRDSLECEDMDRLNSAMSRLLLQCKGGLAASVNELEISLSNILGQGVVNSGGAWLLSSENKKINPKIADFSDLTGVECFVNHIHLEDLLSLSSRMPFEVLQQGLLFVRGIEQILTCQAPHECFSIILVVDENECTVRFHKRRPGEHWLSENLDAYSEAVLERRLGSMALT